MPPRHPDAKATEPTRLVLDPEALVPVAARGSSPNLCCVGSGWPRWGLDNFHVVKLTTPYLGGSGAGVLLSLLDEQTPAPTGPSPCAARRRACAYQLQFRQRTINVYGGLSILLMLS